MTRDEMIRTRDALNEALRVRDAEMLATWAMVHGWEWTGYEARKGDVSITCGPPGQFLSWPGMGYGQTPGETL